MCHQAGAEGLPSIKCGCAHGMTLGAAVGDADLAGRLVRAPPKQVAQLAANTDAMRQHVCLRLRTFPRCTPAGS